MRLFFSRAQQVIDPETGLEISQSLPEEKLDEIRQLITSAVGINIEEN